MEEQTFRSESQCLGQRNARNINNELQRIEVLILLDLIGEASPTFCNHFTETKPLFDQLAKIGKSHERHYKTSHVFFAEKKLNTLKLLEAKRRSGTRYFATCPLHWGSVEDDHVPFLKKGVPILHLITTPFPQNWHRQGDNGNNLHHPTINNLMKIMRVFLVEYFKLDKP